MNAQSSTLGSFYVRGIKHSFHPPPPSSSICFWTEMWLFLLEDNIRPCAGNILICWQNQYQSRVYFSSRKWIFSSVRSNEASNHPSRNSRWRRSHAADHDLVIFVIRVGDKIRDAREDSERKKKYIYAILASDWTHSPLNFTNIWIGAVWLMPSLAYQSGFYVDDNSPKVSLLFGVVGVLAARTIGIYKHQAHIVSSPGPVSLKLISPVVSGAATVCKKEIVHDDDLLCWAWLRLVLERKNEWMR